jgi:hypothetical protein
MPRSMVMQLFGREADKMLTGFFKRRPDYGIVRCNSCGRWQDFLSSHTFEALRLQAKAAGWKHRGAGDHCPICTGN